MNLVQKIWDAVLMPFNAIKGKEFLDFSGDKRIYWIYLISSLLLTLYVYFASKRQEKIGRYIFHPKVWLSKSAVIDYTYIFFNSLIKVFILSVIINWGRYISFYFEDSLINWFGYSTFEISSFLVLAFFTLSITIFEDFFSFAIHGLFHYVPFLWNFHKVHHSATVLNPITQYRIHPIELAFNNIGFLLAFGICHGFFSWLFFEQREIFSQEGVNILAVIFFLWGANLRHSHVRLTYFPWLEKVFISPFQHQIHHSDNPKHFNKNLGSKLAIWDWIFGTLVLSKDVKTIRFGIGKENEDFKSFWKTLWMPFWKVLRK